MKAVFVPFYENNESLNEYLRWQIKFHFILSLKWGFYVYKRAALHFRFCSDILATLIHKQ